VVFLLPDGRRLEVEVAEGVRVLDAARAAGIPIEGACGGALACATCHVMLPEAWYARFPPPSPEEEEMLELAPELSPTSRLGCQLRLEAGLEGVTIQVPASSLLA